MDVLTCPDFLFHLPSTRGLTVTEHMNAKMKKSGEEATMSISKVSGVVLRRPKDDKIFTLTGSVFYMLFCEA